MVAHKHESGLIGTADVKNPERKRGWLWVIVAPALEAFQLALSSSAEVAKRDQASSAQGGAAG
jgi:hypothetical protein